MSTSTKAFLDGIPLSSAGTINWQITEGVRPFQTTFVIEKYRGQQIIDLARNKPRNNPYFMLSITNPDSSFPQSGTVGQVDFKNLVLVAYEPHNDPRFIRLNFADNRIFWFRSYFRGDFNIRTSLGNKEVTRELEGDGPILEEFGGKISIDVENRIQYRTYSLYPPLIERSAESESPRPWTVKEMILKILSKINQDIPIAFNPVSLNFGITEADLDALSFIDEVLKEDIELDGPSHSALAGILELVPNIGTYVDKDGNARFFSKHGGGEEAILSSAPYPYDGSEVPIYVNNDFFVPEYIEVQFESELEVRFDYFERLDTQILDFPSLFDDIPSLPTGSTFAGKAEGRYLENVIPVPDKNFTVSPLSGEASYGVVSGQYINIDDYIRSLSLVVNTDLSIPVFITKPFLREFLLNGLAPSFANFFGDTFELADVRSAWNRRIDGLKEHYRKTYRFNPFWRNRMMNTKASRTAYISSTEPLRAPSPVYFNYAKKLTTKGAIAVNKGVYFNVFNYDPEISKAFPVPWASINFTGEEENGIFTLSLGGDPYGHNETIYPYTIANVPDIKYGSFLSAHCTDDYAILGGAVSTAGYSGVPPVAASTAFGTTGGRPAGAVNPDHSLSTIITSTPVASPGVKLFSIKVTPSMLEGPMKSKIVGAKGPKLIVKVPPSTQTARFVWRDKSAVEIEEAFGIRRSADGSLEDVQPDYIGLEPLLLNKSQLTSLAVQFAAEQYAPYVPRKRGGIITSFNDLYPDGTISTISHTITPPTGKITTSFSIDEEYRPPNWIQMLPSSIRAFIQKFVKRDAP